MVVVVHGVAKCKVPFQGQTVAAIREAVKAQLLVPDDALATINGKPVPPEHQVRRGDTLEFVTSIRKGR